MMPPSDGLQISDAAVVARYLRLRNYFHDELLPQIEHALEQKYEVQPARRIPLTLGSLVRNGFLRPREGELWPVVFLTPVNISMALAVQLTTERLTALGTVVNGPRPLRHRHWEDWWGWEATLAEIHPRIFHLFAPEQEAVVLNWYNSHLEWLARNGLLGRKKSG
ncbi:MAG: hypothetical protein K2R98_13750 [Gemmataceae bacterium]|nr:hypothetical protein [Gemmataceae bacterium]